MIGALRRGLVTGLVLSVFVLSMPLAFKAGQWIAQAIHGPRVYLDLRR